MEQISFEDEDPVISAVNEPHLACILLLDTSGSMVNEMDNLNDAINKFKENVSMDELSRKRVDVAIVEFNSYVRVVQNFVPISEMQSVHLRAGGVTSMGEGINQAIDLLKERNAFYQRLGTPCFKPWIFMLTDGEPTDSIESAKVRIKEEESKGKVGKLKFFALGVKDYNKQVLFSLTNRVMELRDTDFTGIFNWLSESMVSISVSTPADEARLPVLPENARKADPSRDVSDW